ncbi:glycosyltransferase family 4 protein [Corynebacterium casei]|uniref:glycosyltransferase family 4 protein n=1 Tax=Corynebacterium casei TaxID=160386 RepID=UPI003FD43953
MSTYNFGSVTALVSASFFMFLEDPRKFLKNVKLRLARDQKFPVPKFFSSAMPVRHGESIPRQLVRNGDISSGLELIHLNRIKYLPDTFFYLAWKQQLGILESELPAVDSKWFHSKEITVLHFLTNSLPFTTSGYSLRSHSILSAQIELGIQTEAVTRYGYPADIGKLFRKNSQTINNVRYTRIVPWIWNPRIESRIHYTVEELKRIVKLKEISILHTTTGGFNALIVARVASQKGVPWIYEVRGAPESTWLSKISMKNQAMAMKSEFFLKSQYAELRAMQAADAVVVLSETHKAELESRGVSSAKITVIPNGIDEEYINREFDQQSIRTELDLPPGRLIGSVSSLVGYEGFEYLIRALLNLSSDTYVVLVGDGEERSRLIQLAEELGVSERVILPGLVDRRHAWKWYAALDVFVIPRIDSDVTRKITPIKGVLAQALGIPVVGSDLPAIREVTGNLGYYFAPGKVDELVKALELAGKNSRRSENLNWAKQRTWRKNAEAYKVLYENLLSP